MKKQKSSEKTIFTRVVTPVGKLVLVGTLERDGGELAMCGIYFDGKAHGEGAVPDDAEENPKAFGPVVSQLKAYFLGKLTTFEVPLATSQGTPFQRDVWRALAKIPYGETKTYAEIARSIGRPKAVRAVGAANGRNPWSIVVPCHRVIGADGTLTGYAGGLDRKKKLLALEAAR